MIDAGDGGRGGRRGGGKWTEGGRKQETEIMNAKKGAKGVGPKMAFFVVDCADTTTKKCVNLRA